MPSENSLDESYKVLLDEDRVTAARIKGEKVVEQWTTEKYKEIRILCKTDPFFLGYTILGYKDFSPNLHGNLSEWMQRTQDKYQFREILLPRGHFKSTLVTITGAVQLALPDDTNSLKWPYNLGTNCRILIAHETLGQAQNFLFAISTHFLSNPLLMALFPECVPSLRKHRVNKNELELPRSEIWPEPTIDTMGVGGKSQGRHYNFLKLDDLFGDKARDSEAERTTTYQWFDNIQSFFSNHSEDKFDLVGTRWALDDLYSHAEKMYESELVRYVRPIWEYRCKDCGHYAQQCSCQVKTNNIERKLIFPERFNEKKLKVLQKNRKVWTAQYLNDPVEGGKKFEDSWLRYYEWTNDRYTTFRFKDNPEQEEWQYKNIWDLDRVILVDPATTGEYGFIVTGMDFRRRKFVLEARQEIWTPADFMDYLFRSVLRWQPRVVGIEEVLFSTLYQIWAMREMSIRGIKFRIEPLKIKSRQNDKALRVEALQTYFSGFEIFVHESQEELLDQYKFFGSIQHYHVLDALAHGPQLWRLPTSEAITNSYGQDNFSDGRDPVYGYSEI